MGRPRPSDGTSGATNPRAALAQNILSQRFSETAPQWHVACKENQRDRARSTLSLNQNLMNDFYFALRQLRKSPAFTLLAVLTLAIGIGMNTAIFSLMHDLFLRGLPFSEPERVVRIYGEAKERDLKQMPFSVPKFWHYRDGQTTFSSIAADWRNGFIMTGMGEPTQLLCRNLTANYFDLLALLPILGRNFLAKEESKGDVVLVTESF